MTKTFIYNNTFGTMYTKRGFKREYSMPSEWTSEMEEYFEDFLEKGNISSIDILVNSETDNDEICEEFLDWFLDEYEDGEDFLIFREVDYEE